MLHEVNDRLEFGLISMDKISEANLGANGSTRWFAYPLSEFSADKGEFGVRVGPNRFSLKGAEVRLGPGGRHGGGPPLL